MLGRLGFSTVTHCHQAACWARSSPQGSSHVPVPDTTRPCPLSQGVVRGLGLRVLLRVYDGVLESRWPLCSAGLFFCPWAPVGLIGSATAAAWVCDGCPDNCVHLDVSILFQLIDLGSPLIQLSPEADKENVDSPLLKF